jgi:hypothetical protein
MNALVVFRSWSRYLGEWIEARRLSFPVRVAALLETTAWRARETP